MGLGACAVGIGLVALALTRPWVPEPDREPFEYDSDRNRYWHAGNWHEGRPPFHPYEYDPERNRYFHPGDADWRPGRPPVP
jgi:hypothetical protein